MTSTPNPSRTRPLPPRDLAPVEALLTVIVLLHQADRPITFTTLIHYVLDHPGERYASLLNPPPQPGAPGNARSNRALTLATQHRDITRTLHPAFVAQVQP